MDLSKKLDNLQQEQLEPKVQSKQKNNFNKKERQVRRMAYERYYAMRDNPLRADAEKDWEMADKEYSQYVPDIDPDDWRSYLNLPDSFAAIQTQMQETIERKSRPTLIAVEDSDEPIAEFCNSVMNYNMNCTNYDYQIFMAKLSAAIRGTSFVMDYWRTDKRVVQDPSSVNEDGTLKYEPKEVIDLDDDYTEWVPNEYIFIDEKAKHIDEAVDMVRREVLNIDEFRRVYTDKPGFSNVEFVSVGGELSNRSFFQMPKDFNEQDVEILHYFNRSLDAYWVVANNTPIRTGNMPYKHKELPVAVFYQYRIPGQFWGMGVPKVIFYLSEERKAIRRLALDRQKLTNSGAFLVNNSFDIDDEEATLQPGRMIGVDTNGLPLNQAIERVDLGDVSPSHYRMEEVILEDTRRAHGIDDRIVVSDQSTTATQAAIVKESSLKRLNMISTLAEMDTVKRIGKIKWSNIQFFYPVPRMERIVEDNEERTKKVYRQISVDGKKFSIVEDDGGKSLKMDEVTGRSALSLDKTYSKYLNKNYDVDISAEAYTPPSKAIQQTKAQELFSLFLSNPMTMSKLSISDAMADLLKLNNFKYEKWLRPDAAPAHEMVELADAENMIMAAGQPLSPTKNATEEHTMEHLNYTQTVEFHSLPPEFQALFQAHIMGESASNPATADLGAQVPQGPEVGPPSQGINPNTTQPQPQPADLQATNYTNPA